MSVGLTPWDKLVTSKPEKGSIFGHDTYRPRPFYHTWLNHWFHIVSLAVFVEPLPSSSPFNIQFNSSGTNARFLCQSTSHGISLSSYLQSQAQLESCKASKVICCGHYHPPYRKEVAPNIHQPLSIISSPRSLQAPDNPPPKQSEMPKPIIPPYKYIIMN